VNALICIEPANLVEEMGWILARCGLPQVEGDLLNGRAGAYRIAGTDAALILSAGRTVDTDVPALWITSLGGVAGWRPHRNKQILAAALEDCEAIARASNCTEIRIEAGTRTGLKLRLFQNFGFEAKRLPTTIVMRKAL
jgi:hypothetical protein